MNGTHEKSHIPMTRDHTAGMRKYFPCVNSSEYSHDMYMAAMAASPANILSVVVVHMMLFGLDHILCMQQQSVLAIQCMDCFKNRSLFRSCVCIYVRMATAAADPKKNIVFMAIYHAMDMAISAAPKKKYISVKYVYLNTPPFIIHR